MKTIALPRRQHGATALILLTLLMGGYAHAEEPSTKSPATISPGNWVSAGYEHHSDFHCPTNQVMTGRKHHGDEEEETFYKCGKVNQFGDLTTVKHKEYPPIDENWSKFKCDKDTVMTGRKHEGDENDPTTYTCAELVDSWGNKIQVSNNAEMHGPYDEDAHEFQCPTNQAITGREHDHDENGDTRYMCAYLW